MSQQTTGSTAPGVGRRWTIPVRMVVQIGGGVLLFLTALLLPAEELVYDFLPYAAPGTPGTPGSPGANEWTVTRETTEEHVEITFDAEVVFYLFGRISYQYSGAGRFDRGGNLLEAESTMEVMGRRHTVAIEEPAEIDLSSRPKPRTLTAEEALVLALDFLNPEAIRGRIVPGESTPFPRLDIAQGRITAVELTTQAIDSPLLQRPVLRAGSETMVFLFDPDTLTLLYASSSDIGFGAELILQRD